MGGPGSGEWIRTITNRTTDSVPRLSISELSKAVSLTYLGNTGRLSWKFNGRVIAAYWVSFDGERIHFRTESGGNLSYQHASDQSIELESTECYFGGMRRWILCPKCDQRVAVLYLVAQKWICRKCGRIRYSSQQETPDARLTRRLRKIRNQLRASRILWEPPTSRPKGMHWKTYINLTNCERQLRSEWLRRVAVIDSAKNPGGGI